MFHLLGPGQLSQPHTLPFKKVWIMPSFLFHCCWRVQPSIHRPSRATRVQGGLCPSLRVSQSPLQPLAHHCGSLSHPSEPQRQNWGPQPNLPEEHPTSHYDFLMTKAISLLLSTRSPALRPQDPLAHHALTTKPHNPPFGSPTPDPRHPRAARSHSHGLRGAAWGCVRAAWGRVGPRGAAGPLHLVRGTPRLPARLASLPSFPRHCLRAAARRL